MNDLDKLKESIAQPVTEQFLAGMEYGWLAALKWLKSEWDNPHQTIEEVFKKLLKEISELEKP